jgi:hypothetical protein
VSARAALAGFVLAVSAGGLSGSPASASAGHCVSAEEAHARAADEDAPPKFTSAFYARTFTLDASLDGLDGPQLPVSIEQVCDIPKSLKKQAVRLSGTDGVALLSTHTSVWLGGQRVSSADTLTQLDGADTALLRVRLTPRRQWAQDEDGNKVPTFTARRITITD